MQEGVLEVSCKSCRLNSAGAVADECVRVTKASQMSPLAKDIALAAIAEYPDGELSLPAYRAAIAKRVKAERQCGFFFSVFVLPLMISVISGWVVQWFANRKTALPRMKADADECLSRGCR